MLQAALWMLLLLSVFGSAFGWPQQSPDWTLMPSPGNVSDEAVLGSWRRKWGAWKELELEILGYDKNAKCNGHNMDKLKWTQSNFVQPQLMVHDRLLFDRATNKWTIDKYVKTMKERYGGVDSVLLWYAYPNMGVDNRNQFQWLESLPGNLTDVVDTFHKLGVKVFLPYLPWDQGTADEVGKEDAVRMYTSDVENIYELVDRLHIDGINGDTMYGLPMEFFKCDRPIAMCPEGGVPMNWLSTNTMSWLSYWNWPAGGPPPVSRAKFLEPRHMSYICSRWSKNRIRDVQLSFFNGVGYETWENVWGIWNGMTKRDDAAVKRVFEILRYFAEAITSEKWEPYAKVLNPQSDAIFSSRFPMENGTTLWTVIKDREKDANVVLQVYNGSGSDKFQYFDVYHGESLLRSCTSTKGVTTCTVEFPIEGYGFGAVVAIPHKPSLIAEFPIGGDRLQTAIGVATTTDLSEFLERMKNLTKVKLVDLSNEHGFIKQQLLGWTDADNSKYLSKIDVSTIPTSVKENNMLLIPGTKTWEYKVQATMIEPGNDSKSSYGVGVQFPWESRPWFNHSHSLRIPAFFIDQGLVTNGQYKSFLDESSYKPKDTTNFLKHWLNTFDKDGPIVWVSREDAEAYCAHYKKRLPHDFEWQYASSNGTNNFLYPWGNDPPSSKNVPPPYRGKLPSIPASVSGGCRGKLCDMSGRLWQMTDSFCDEYSCSQLLRGGSFYRPQASTFFDNAWYFPNVPTNNWHGKFLTMSESYDRSGLVSFRCVKDS
mmetsp:Transcript_31105/g.49813  ORF Transcript_31105/g.49813 Transcript_31105/m.49813 type:complete len:764 (-) Transcript_31105:37-2328(-)